MCCPLQALQRTTGTGKACSRDEFDCVSITVICLLVDQIHASVGNRGLRSRQVSTRLHSVHHRGVCIHVCQALLLHFIVNLGPHSPCTTRRPYRLRTADTRSVATSQDIVQLRKSHCHLLDDIQNALAPRRKLPRRRRRQALHTNWIDVIDARTIGLR